MSDRPLVVVQDEPAFEALLGELEGLSRVGVDTEANSFHAYRERVCLVQIGTDTKDYVVDPLAVDLQPLGELFADPKREVIFHAAEYDILTLKKDYGFEFAGLFDTQAAVMCMGRDQVGLAALVKEHFDVTLPKTHQRSDWGKRPLDDAQLRYAANDVRFLCRLRDRLDAQLGELDRREDARSMIARICRSEPRERVFDEEGFYKIKGFRELTGAGRAIVRALYLVREARAKAKDRPPFKVLGNDVIVRIAARPPRNERELERVRGLPGSARRGWGHTLLEAIRNAADTEPPPARRPLSRDRAGKDRDTEARYEALRAWRKKYTSERGVALQVMATGEMLKAMARKRPQSIEELVVAGGLDDFAVRTWAKGALAAAQSV